MAHKFKLKAKNSSGEQRLIIDPTIPEWDENLIAITLVGEYEGEDIQIDFDEVEKDKFIDMLKLLLSDLEAVTV